MESASAATAGGAPGGRVMCVYCGLVRSSSQPAVARRARWGVTRRARWAVSAQFLVMGLTQGMWMARIPAAKSQAGLSDGLLGAALFAVPIGLLLGAAVAERMINRAGSAAVARAGGVGSCVILLAPGLASDLPELMAALLGMGFVFGMLDVAQNGQGLRVEESYGRPVVTSMHAFYSLGAIVGSLAGGGLAWAGVTLLPSLAVAGAAGALIDAAAGRWFLPGAHHGPAEIVFASPVTPSGESSGPLPAGTAAPGPATPGSTEAGSTATSATPGAADRRLTSREPDRQRVRRAIIAIGVIGVCGMVGEGAAGDWSAVYLRDNLGTSAGFAALAFAAFSVTMTTGRALGDLLIHRFGVVPLIRVCGAVAAAGLAGGLIAANPAVAIVGFAFFGAGLSAVVPQAFAAGGRADPARPGSGIAKVVGFSYAGQAGGPAVIGAVASRIGLHAALVIPVVLALWIVVAASALAPPPGSAVLSPDRARDLTRD